MRTTNFCRPLRNVKCDRFNSRLSKRGFMHTLNGSILDRCECNNSGSDNDSTQRRPRIRAIFGADVIARIRSHSIQNTVQRSIHNHYGLAVLCLATNATESVATWLQSQLAQRRSTRSNQGSACSFNKNAQCDFASSVMQAPETIVVPAVGFDHLYKARIGLLLYL